MLTAAGCDAFAQLGVRTVIDLRVEAERIAKPEADCVAQRAELVSAPLPVPYNVSPLDYIADLEARDSIAIAFGRLAVRAAYPVYVHCTWGRDRTGVLIAVMLRALGATHSDIIEEYQLSELSVGAYPESLQAALDWIEARGGVEAYLEAAGVSAAQLAALRARTVSGE